MQLIIDATAFGHDDLTIDMHYDDTAEILKSRVSELLCSDIYIPSAFELTFEGENIEKIENIRQLSCDDKLVLGFSEENSKKSHENLIKEPAEIDPWLLLKYRMVCALICFINRVGVYYFTGRVTLTAINQEICHYTSFVYEYFSNFDPFCFFFILTNFSWSVYIKFLLVGAKRKQYRFFDHTILSLGEFIFNEISRWLLENNVNSISLK